MSEHAVVVGSYDMAEEAHLARIRLAQHGIPAFVSDDKHVGPMIVLPGLGGWAVRVRTGDRDRALGILEGPADADGLAEGDGETALDDDPAADPEAVPASDLDGEAETPALDAPPPPPDPSRPPCPACGSADVTTERFLPRWEWLMFLATWLARLALPLRPKTRWMCVDCGRRWKVDED